VPDDPTPRPTDVARIAAIGNRVVRNLEITQCYAELSHAMRLRTGEAANWCTFATWASRQAGATIRGEDLLDGIGRHLSRKARLLEPLRSANRWLLRKGMFASDTRLGRVMAEIHTPLDAFERASEEVAAGNLKVFAEIGRAFARFIEMVPNDAGPDSDEFLAFAADLRAGPPPDGQDLLKDAFAHYQQRRHETDPALAAAWMLLANLKIGLHEQTRLQSQIAAAVDAPLSTAKDLGERVLHALVPGARRWPAALHRPAVTSVGWLSGALRRTAVRVTREVVTESLMVLALPDRVLALGRNLDAPLPAGLAGVPPPVLAEVTREYDPCPPGGTACGASDWCDLRQRMHYILHLFRAFAVDASLFRPPFTVEQVARFRAGVVPDGDL